ncbi:MAG: KOW motif-containing protein, partial [Pseudomonadota bacterium]
MVVKNKNVGRQKMHVRTGDTVQVITGKDKGKVGEVVATNAKTSQVIVLSTHIHALHDN